MCAHRSLSRRGIVLGIFSASIVLGDAAGQPPVEPPRAEVDAPTAEVRTVPIPEAVEPGPAVDAAHEATRPEGDPAPASRAPKAPPIPVEERPSEDRPDASSRWVSGYWSWDDRLDKFVWVPGTWVIPPQGRFWVDGTWRRDENGWYRVRGFWSSRRDTTVARPAATAAFDWRRTGPPAPPAEDPGDAPAPNTFYVPGHYEPARDGRELVWVPGFWSASQPGWDWMPARWVRLAGGWDYRPGHWVKEGSPSGPLDVNRHLVARPRDDREFIPASGLDRDEHVGVQEPAIIDDRAAAPPGSGESRALVTPGRIDLPPGVYVVPGYPPYTYGPYRYYDGRLVPRGAVLPYVPPFVRGLLDRVMP